MEIQEAEGRAGSVRKELLPYAGDWPTSGDGDILVASASARSKKPGHRKHSIAECESGDGASW